MPQCSRRSPYYSWAEMASYPSGYWLQGLWCFTNCSIQQRPTISSYRTCLQTKNLFFYGDSTIRHYCAYFSKTIMGGKTHYCGDYGDANNYHSRPTYSNFGINLAYLKHAMPLWTPNNVSVSSITSLGTELIALADSDIPDETIIVVLGYHLHFDCYSFEIYKQRHTRSITRM